METELERQKQRVGIQEQCIFELQQQLDAATLDCVNMAKDLKEFELKELDWEEKLHSATQQTQGQYSRIINLEKTVL